MLSTPTFIPNSLTPQSWEAGIREIVYLLSARELKRQNLIRIDLQGLQIKRGTEKLFRLLVGNYEGSAILYA